MNETMESLSARDWRAFYAPLLSAGSPPAIRRLRHHDRAALQVEVAGTNSTGAALQIREIYVPLRAHLLILTVSGPTAMVSAHEPDIDRWSEAVVFTAIR